MCRILAIAERQDRVLAALGAEPKFREATFGGPDVARPEAQPRFRGLAADLADQLRNREFVAESVDGVQARADLQQRETAIDEARPSRWIQASGWRPDAPKLSARSLAPCEWNLLTCTHRALRGAALRRTLANERLEFHPWRPAGHGPSRARPPASPAQSLGHQARRHQAHRQVRE